MSATLTLLPALCFAAWTWGFRRLNFGWRKALLCASLPFWASLVYMTELLSAWHALTRIWVALGWLVLGAGALVWAARIARRDGLPSGAVAADAGVATPASVEAWDPWDKAALIWAGILVAVVGLTAIVSAPNTWDALKYHLPRVVEWIGHRGVQFYPTVDRQQLTMPPMSEYGMLHLEILFGSDRLVSLVSWFGFLGAILGISLVAEELGGDRRTQVFAAVLGATVPSAMLAASSAKNDNLLAYWMVASLYFALLWRREQSVWLALGIGASVAGAVCTKGTAYTFLPWIALAGSMLCDGRARRRLIWCLPLAAVVVVSVCGPFWWRNYRMAGSPLGLPYYDGEGSVDGRKFQVDHLSVTEAVAGLTRNVAVDLALPSERINRITTKLCSDWMWTIGVDPNDFGQLFRSQTGNAHPFRVSSHFRDEYYGGNTWNLILFLGACALYLANFRGRFLAEPARPGWRRLGWLAVAVAGAFLTFSAMVRWGPWNGKYQMPIFAMSVAFVALVLAARLPRRAVLAVEFCLLALSVPLAAMNTFRPWISVHGVSKTLVGLPRDRTYFLNDFEGRADAFVPAAQAVRATGCKRIGLDVGLEHLEYPMMALIARGDPAYGFTYLDVANPSTAYAPAGQPAPCVVVCLGCARSAEKLQEYGSGHRAEIFGRDVAVFTEREDGEAQSGPAVPR